MTEISRTTGIDPQLDAYEGFFDSEFGYKLMQIVKNTVLVDPVFDLLRSWRAASSARSLPWVFAKLVETIMEQPLEE